MTAAPPDWDQRGAEYSALGPRSQSTRLVAERGASSHRDREKTEISSASLTKLAILTLRLRRSRSMAASAASSVPLWNGLKSEKVVSSASDEWRDLRRGLLSLGSSRGAGGAKLVRGLRTDGGGNASLEEDGSLMMGGTGLVDLRRALGGGTGACSAGGGVLFLGVVI